MDTATILIIAGLLHLTLLLAHGTHIALSHGVRWGTGRRSATPELSDLDRRFDRTVTNNMESMIAFVPIMSVMLVTGAETPQALLAAQLYIAARAAFAALYLLNIPYIRTFVWFVSVACVAAIAIQTLAATIAA